jgi:t-SNARE complex subunit (syntaxin)
MSLFSLFNWTSQNKKTDKYVDVYVDVEEDKKETYKIQQYETSNKDENNDLVSWLSDVDINDCLVIRFDQEEYLEEQRKRRRLEILDISTQVRQIMEISKSINELVNLQQDSLDITEDNVQSTENNVEKAEEELEKATRYSKQGVLLSTALLSICLGGPLGVVYGIKVGASVFLVTGTSGYAITKMY